MFRKAQNTIQDLAKRDRLIADRLDGDLELSSVDPVGEAFSVAAPAASTPSGSR